MELFSFLCLPQLRAVSITYHHNYVQRLDRSIVMISPLLVVMARNLMNSTPFDITHQIVHEYARAKGISIRIQALELLTTSTTTSSKPTITSSPTPQQPTQSHHEDLQQHPQPGRRCLRSRSARRD
jgi:hypothetical protein